MPRGTAFFHTTGEKSGLGAQQSHHEREHREPEAGANSSVTAAPPTRSARRSCPTCPTISESGLPGFEATSWYCIVAPAGVPEPIVTRLHTELVKILNSPEIRDRLIAERADCRNHHAGGIDGFCARRTPEVN
jgi:tripartite tricarboxylate transporter family receptor